MLKFILLVHNLWQSICMDSLSFKMYVQPQTSVFCVPQKPRNWGNWVNFGNPRWPPWPHRKKCKHWFWVSVHPKVSKNIQVCLPCIYGIEDGCTNSIYYLYCYFYYFTYCVIMLLDQVILFNIEKYIFLICFKTLIYYPVARACGQEI